jgi:hypothetical protein
MVMKVGDLVKVKARSTGNRVKIGLVVEVATYNGSGAVYGYMVKPVDGSRPIMAEVQDMEVISESR